MSTSVSDASAMVADYQTVRSHTDALAAPLSSEDQCIQSMPDVSPTKWHRGHTTWFFETFILMPKLARYEHFHPEFCYLFNSYYEAVGQRHPRSERGNLSRPGCEQVAAYRACVDDAMCEFIAQCLDAETSQLLALGLQHEQQHQELLLMDIKNVLSQNQALWPVYGEVPVAEPLNMAHATSTDKSVGATSNGNGHSPHSNVANNLANKSSPRWLVYDGGEMWLGHSGDGFAYDNETPCHRVLLGSYKLASQLITCADWLEFMADGGYHKPTLWLSDGWYKRQELEWEAPLYWHFRQDQWFKFTLQGLQPLAPDEPVCHISYYEADAFARWAGTRLPTEVEWEHAAKSSAQPLSNMFSCRWQWTASPYCAYPGFRPASGAVGEYNGKFMVNQFVLRGGSCATPTDHIRATYRNFFHPHTRWHFSGMRLAKDAP